MHGVIIYLLTYLSVISTSLSLSLFQWSTLQKTHTSLTPHKAHFETRFAQFTWFPHICGLLGCIKLNDTCINLQDEEKQSNVWLLFKYSLTCEYRWFNTRSFQICRLTVNKHRICGGCVFEYITPQCSWAHVSDTKPVESCWDTYSASSQTLSTSPSSEGSATVLMSLTACSMVPGWDQHHTTGVISITHPSLHPSIPPSLHPSLYVLVELWQCAALFKHGAVYFKIYIYKSHYLEETCGAINNTCIESATYPEHEVVLHLRLHRGVVHVERSQRL